MSIAEDPKNLKSGQAPKELEYGGPLWKHPYMLYVILTLLLFIFLLLMGWMALKNDWIPKRL